MIAHPLICRLLTQALENLMYRDPMLTHGARLLPPADAGSVSFLAYLELTLK
ncbi:MAG TPA: hypothetical protein VGC91_15640 [Pyrinomonadaceae bacterium]